MSRLTRLDLSHFRSHLRSVVDTAGRSVVLFGPNGAGKTNVLEAVSLLSPGRGLRRAGAEELARRPDDLGWKITAEIETGEDRHELASRAVPGTSRQVEINGKPAPQLALARLLRVIWLTPALDRLWSGGASDRRRFLDRVTMSLHPAHAETSLAYEKAMRERNRLLKDGRRDARWYEALEAQMAVTGAQIDGARRDAVVRITAAQQEATTGFPVAEMALTGPDGTDERLTEEGLRQVLGRGRGTDLAAGRSLAGPHRSDLTAIYAAKGVEARLCSTGEQKALLISLILANARALSNAEGQPPIVLLDEVAAHLDEERRAALYDEIDAIGVQTWLTGTGSELFEPLAGRALLLQVSEENGCSQLATVG